MTPKESAKVIFGVLHDDWFSWTPEVVEAFNMAISALEKQEEDRWIPVTERMPEWHWINPEADEDDRVWDGEKVVICGTIGHWPYSGVACAMYGPDGWQIEDDAFSIDDEPVAWMPLPEPYTEEKA